MGKQARREGGRERWTQEGEVRQGGKKRRARELDMIKIAREGGGLVLTIESEARFREAGGGNGGDICVRIVQDLDTH